MRGSGTGRQLVALLVLADAATAGFIAAILAGLGSGYALHEIAGLVLLVLLLLALSTAYRWRPVNPRPVIRVAVALAALVVAAVLGGALAAGAVVSVGSGLPLVPLAVVIVACSDAIRVAYRD